VPPPQQPAAVACPAPRPNPPKGLLKDACGLPFAAVVQPLAPPPAGLPLHAAAGPAPLALLARCRHCYAYLNTYCELTDSGFVCSLCGRANDFGGRSGLRQRYLRQPMARQLLPELAYTVYEVDCGGDGEGGGGAAPSAPAASAAAAGGSRGGGAPAYLAVVDVAGDEEFLELVGWGVRGVREGD
jgi:hypothetical protein